MNSRGWIGVDFDGTLSRYDRWEGEYTFGPPVPAMLARVKAWVHDGVEVRIFTARASEDPDGKVAKAIQDWLVLHGLPRLKVTCRKDFQMVQLWDDRAVQVLTNKGQSVIEALKEAGDLP